MTDARCIVQNAGRRRVFWTTQPEACRAHDLCGVSCVVPGLKYEDSEEPTPLPAVPRTIVTSEWLRSLILNIINTRARTDLKCPSPAAVFGHWSESYRGDNLYVGSTLWNVASKSYTRIGDSVKAITAAIKADMGKLVAMKVADSVEVIVTYRGGSRVDVVITATVTNTRHVLDLSGSFVSDTWAWQ